MEGVQYKCIYRLVLIIQSACRASPNIITDLQQIKCGLYLCVGVCIPPMFGVFTSPQYATFYYHGDVDRVRVKFTSDDDLCAVAAVQKSLVHG